MPEMIIRRGEGKKPKKEKAKTDSGKIREFISDKWWHKYKWYVIGGSLTFILILVLTY